MILDFTEAPATLRCYACDRDERREIFIVVAVLDGNTGTFAACLPHILAELAPILSHDHTGWREAA